MDLTPYVESLQRRLGTVAEAGGEEARLFVERLTAPLDDAVRLILLHSLSTAAAEISNELEPGSVEVRLHAGEPEFVVSLPHRAPAGAARAALTAEGGPTTRVTLRLPGGLKSRVESAAARDGVSINTWLLHAAAAALEPGRMT
ncbi:histidine kinase [Myceligenerans pegani]|uniref:Histidine kinase n=1 Tax=Myceligenerans pegani TaxID=2776917 RepID=A0ABR9MYX2_9MICO|nr:histidine kinase [Myceligenerans sp. TRM 65318]MBE1876586.1 histidine kinase [Myceligenerans sp. TRM 65318]MBE3018857.1 histidine kinase [Myceligenerans sp. TRM 65318]